MSDIRIASRFKPHRVKGISFMNPSLTQQHFKDECDINLILKNALDSKQKVTMSRDEMLSQNFFDCTTVDDFTGAVNYVQSVREDFDSLPSIQRKFFGNNPENYVAFMVDPRNHSRAIEMGLLAGERRASLPRNPYGSRPSGEDKKEVEKQTKEPKGDPEK